MSDRLQVTVALPRSKEPSKGPRAGSEVVMKRTVLPCWESDQGRRALSYRGNIYRPAVLK